MRLPPDGHVHSEWSWDSPRGDMIGSCARALELGLPAIVLTDHLDVVPVLRTPADFAPEQLPGLDFAPDGTLTAPVLDAGGYLAAVEHCRERFPDLRILTGAEVGEPHRDPQRIADVLAAGRFDRVLGSLHALPFEGRFLEPLELYRRLPAAEVMRRYLDELLAVIAGSDAFDVLTHVDYAVRAWPEAAGPFAPEAFEEGFRTALAALARTGRALECNTRIPLAPVVLDWWREEGGTTLAFGSDSHWPGAVGRGLADAAAVAADHGFGPANDPAGLWLAGA